MIAEIRLPEISENVDSGEVIQVLVKVGDYLEAEQPVVEMETEKATFEVPCPVNGKVVEILVKEGQKLSVGQTILKIDTETKKVPQEKSAPTTKPTEREEKAQGQDSAIVDIATAETQLSEETPKQTQEEARQRAEPDTSRVYAAPSARKLARELGIDISKIAGTGPAGRISDDDVKRYVKNIVSGNSTREEQK